MKRSFFSRCLLVFAIAVLAIFTFAGHVSDAVVSTFRMAKNLVLDALSVMGSSSGDRSPTAVRIKQAKAFKSRLDARDRPVLTESWRMCPSV